MSSVTSRRLPGRPAAGDQPRVPPEEEILERGLATFAELGYEGATVRELARRLGVSHNFINDRYGSKEGFWRAVVGQAHAHIVDAVAPRRAGRGKHGVREMVRAFFRAVAEEPALMRIIDEAVRSGGPRLDYVYGEHLGPMMEGARPLLERAVRNGTVRAYPPEVVFVAMILFSRMEGARALLALLGRAEMDAALTETLADLLVDGLLTTPRPPAR